MSEKSDKLRAMLEKEKERRIKLKMCIRDREYPERDVQQGYFQESPLLLSSENEERRLHMASLRDTVKDYPEELRDGIAWAVSYTHLVLTWSVLTYRGC